MKKNFKNRLLILILLLLLFSVPKITYAYSSKVYLGGENIGIEVKSKGILVVGFYSVSNKSPGEDSGLKVGDIITKINDTAIKEVADLSRLVNNDSIFEITYERANEIHETNLTPIKDTDQSLKTGLYVKDRIIGIGTLTFIDPNTLTFGALGHEIVDKNTNLRFEISDGTIFKSTINSINKSTRSYPGEKNASYYTNIIYGNITENELTGIYGKYTDSIESKETIDIAENKEITPGKAYIRTVINDEKIENFEINILKTSNANDTKNILFEITDKVLLNKTNGIVQGMSGSPIIQNNKLIGAVTHVVVDNPKRGYGIFISNMLKDAN